MGGYVYAIANDAMPGLVKIGATLRNPEDRLNEARATTWAPSCFRIIAQAAVGDAFGTERTLHALLARRRFDGRREFFVMTHEEAIARHGSARKTQPCRPKLDVGGYPVTVGLGVDERVARSAGFFSAALRKRRPRVWGMCSRRLPRG
jgi:hypothetical protein